MSQEDAANLVRQLQNDTELQASIKSAQADAVLEEAKKAGYEVNHDDMKEVAAGAQKGGVFADLGGQAGAVIGTFVDIFI